MPDANITHLQHQRVIDQFFDVKVASFTKELAKLEQEIPSDATPRNGDEFHLKVADLFQRSQDDCRELQAAIEDCPESLQAARKRFLSETDAWFKQSWIAERARTKPSGFPGDYLMLIKLYEQQTPALGLGGYIDLCIMNVALARAVRGRLLAAREFVLKELENRRGTVKILDIASGPCREFLDFPAQPEGRNVAITAMDSDPAALEYVGSVVAKQLDETVTLNPVRYNALRTRSAETTVELFGKFDILYSVGLCDYLTDDHLISMFSAWHNTLNDGGVMYIAFKDTREYDETPYQWHLDWHFYQRTHEDVLRLYEAAGFDLSKMNITRDPTGIIINYVARHDVATHARIDAMHPLLKKPRRNLVRENSESKVSE